MEVKVKEVVLYARKRLCFPLKYAYRFTYRHPFVASFPFSLFLLYSCYPSLFAFLVSFFPVLFCTALLLGILLSYGEPNLPEIEEDDNINMNISSMKVENSADGFFAKKYESFTLGGVVDNRVGSKERISKDSTHYVDKEREIDFLAVSSSVEEQNKTMENLEFFMKEQSESYLRTSEVTDSVCEGVEGLMVKIKRPPSDDWLDSSLGSPWQPITIRDASSDSESDRAESSSPDASMTDILPMLDELSPLLDSETLHNDPKSVNNSDSELSLHHDSDDESVDKEDECKSECKDEGNTVVTWTADDQKNVMDLGSSDLERNRRLESLIARRRARKNQIIIYEKDLIDFHSNDTKKDELSLFHRQIPPIFAPRGNPFDILHDLDESKVMPPIPGSAPSVLLRRQNPFDFPCDSEDSNNGLAGEISCQPDFEVPSQKGYLFRRHESFVSRSVFPLSNLMHEKLGSSRLNPYVSAEKLDSEGNDYIDFHNHQSEETDTKSSFVPSSDKVSSATYQENTEQETLVPPHHVNPTEQYSRFCDNDLVDYQSELGGDGHSVDPNASAGIDVSDNVKKTTEEIHFVQNHEVVDKKDDDLNLFSSSESAEKRFDEVLETHEPINSVSKGSSEFLQSSDVFSSHLICETMGVDNNQGILPIYDSSPSGSGNFLAGISVPDELLVSTGGGNILSVSTVESLVQEEAANAFEESMTSEVIESKVFEGSTLQKSRSNNGETVEFSAYMNLLDENISVLNEINEDFADQAASFRIVPSSSPSADAANEPGLAFFGCSPPIEAEEKLKSMEYDNQTSVGTRLEEFWVNNSELGPILEENLEDFKVEAELMSLFQTNTTVACSGLQKPERSDVDLSNVRQEVVSLDNQSKEAAQDEGNEAKPSKTPSFFLANDDLFTGLVMGELVDSIDFSNQFKMKSEADCTFNDNNSDSQDIIMNELQINQNVILRNLNDFHSEHVDLNAEFRDLQIIDEHLLSELDAVGDFRVGELKSPEFLKEESPSDSWYVCSGEDSELRSANIVELSENKPISANLTSPDEMDLVLLNQQPTDSGYWSSAMAPVEELTVYNPKLNAHKAYSSEELDAIFQQELPKGSVVSPFSETITEKLVTESSTGLRSFDMEDQEIEAVIREEVLLTLTRKNAGDMSSASIMNGKDFDISISPHLYFQLNDDQPSMDGCKFDLSVVDACGFDSTNIQSSEIMVDRVESVISSTSSLILHSSVISEAETSPEFEIKADISSRGFEIENTDSQVLVLEAKSFEDIYSAFNNVTETVFNKSITLINPEPTANHPVDTIVQSISPEADKTSDLLVLEAKSAEDINSIFKQAAEEGLTTSFFRNHPDFEVMEPSSTGSENSSELFVLEERSTKDMQLAFQLVTEEVSSIPTSLIDSELSKTYQDHEVVEELMLLEGKSSVDTDFAFEQTNVDLDKLTSQAYPASLVNLIDNEVVHLKSLETQIDPELVVVDAKSFEDIDSAFKSSSEGLLRSTSLEMNSPDDAIKVGSAEETNSTLKQVNEGLFDKFSPTVDPDAAGTSEAPHEISHEAENGSDILSLKTKSSQHLNSVCEQEIEADPVQQSMHEFENFQPDHDAVIESPLNTVDKLESFSLESKSFDSEEESFLAAEKHSELTVLEEKSTGNLHSPFSVPYAGVHGSSPSLPVDTEPMENQPGDEVEDNVCSDAENNSEMLVIEAKSLQDKHSFFKQATDTSPPLVESGSPDIQTEQSLLVPEAISVELTHPSSKKVNKKGSKRSTFFIESPSLQTNSDDDPEQLVHEEKSEKDIVASNEAVTGKKSSSEDQINRRTRREEASSEDPSSSAPPSVKIKKKKFEKSDPSSSSSSSSSSSESY